LLEGAGLEQFCEIFEAAVPGEGRRVPDHERVVPGSEAELWDHAQDACPRKSQVVGEPVANQGAGDAEYVARHAAAFVGLDRAEYQWLRIHQRVGHDDGFQIRRRLASAPDAVAPPHCYPYAFATLVIIFGGYL